MTAHDPRRKALDKTVQNVENAKIYDAGVKALTDGQAALDWLPQLEKKIADLSGQVEAFNRPMAVTLKTPAEPKASVKNRDIATSWIAATTAEILRFAGGQDHSKTLTDLLGGDENRLRRADARKMLTKSATDLATTTASGWAFELSTSDTLAFARRHEHLGGCRKSRSARQDDPVLRRHRPDRATA